MSCGEGKATTAVIADEEADARLNKLEGQVRDLDEKTRTQEFDSMETKSRLAEAIREAQVQKTEMANMLADCSGDGVKETKEKIKPNSESAAATSGDDQPAAGSADRKEI